MTVLVNYHLIHKDRMAAELEFDPEGGSLLSIKRVSETQLLPLSCQNQPDKLKYWWAHRVVSKQQGTIKQFYGISSSGFQRGKR